MSDRRDRFVWDEDEFNAILAMQPSQQGASQQDPRLKRWINLGFSPEEAAAMVKRIG
jgi:hypothetical protein